jgi:hypothetical protein
MDLPSVSFAYDQNHETACLRTTFSRGALPALGLGLVGFAQWTPTSNCRLDLQIPRALFFDLHCQWHLLLLAILDDSNLRSLRLH